jgi:hypothetical protein
MHRSLPHEGQPESVQMVLSKDKKGKVTGYAGVFNTEAEAAERIRLMTAINEAKCVRHVSGVRSAG